MKFWSSCLLKENLPFFFCFFVFCGGGGSLIGNHNLQFAETFHNPSVSDRKLMCQFFAQAIDLLDKTSQWNSKFGSFRMLKEISSSKFQISWLGFGWKINFFSKNWTQFSVLTVKGCKKFQQNLTPCFQLSLPKRCWIFSEQARRSKF